MRLRPSRSTLFPYTTLFRSAVERRGRKTAGEEGRADRCSPGMGRSDAGRDGRSDEVLEGEQEMSQKITSYPGHERSEERRVGKECRRGRGREYEKKRCEDR